VADYLQPLGVQDVAGFYRRLAQFINTKFQNDSLAAMLLLHWLDGGGKKRIYSAKYVKVLDEVQDYLKGTARPIFLSQRPTPNHTIGGVVPRIRGTIKANPPGGPYTMHLEGNVETPLSIELKAAAGAQVEERELDALYALHGFTMVSDVIVSATPTKTKSQYSIDFRKWTCKATDTYHWNPDKHITVPNPDFDSKAAGAVAPKDKRITIYHSNASRIEKAGLANPFDNESESWDVIDQFIMGPTSIIV
jgi:hypothetical protein